MQGEITTLNRVYFIYFRFIFQKPLTIIIIVVTLHHQITNEKMKTRSALIQIFNENGLEYTEDAYLETLSVRYAVAHPLNSKRCKAWLCPSAERTGKPWKVEFKGKFVKWCKTREEAQSLIDIIEG